MNQELVEGLLSNLNKEWALREQRHVSRLKAKYHEEIVNLKRQLVSRQPADAVQLKRTVTRLNSELSQLRVKYELMAKRYEISRDGGVALENDRFSSALTAIGQAQNER